MPNLKIAPQHPIATVLADINIIAKQTRDNIFTVSVDSVPADRCGQLAGDVLTINAALKDAGLYPHWRARIGGTTNLNWILVIRDKDK